MREIGIDLSERRPRRLTDELAEQADVVVTMGCGDACPYIPGKRYLDWDLPDPTGQPVDEVRATRDDIAAASRSSSGRSTAPPITTAGGCMTRIGINGFGRMGRLALRAAWDGPDLEFVHVNELHGDAATAAHLLDVRLRARSLGPRRRRRRRAASPIDGTDDRVHAAHAAPGDVPWDEHGVDVVLECTGQVPHAGDARAVLRARRAQGHRRRARQGRPRAERRHRRQRRPLRPRRARHRHRGVVHDELPRAGREGHPRGDRHRARRRSRRCTT